jgi:hypothetical protein
MASIANQRWLAHHCRHTLPRHLTRSGDNGDEVRSSPLNWIVDKWFASPIFSPLWQRLLDYISYKPSQNIKLNPFPSLSNVNPRLTFSLISMKAFKSSFLKTKRICQKNKKRFSSNSFQLPDSSITPHSVHTSTIMNSSKSLWYQWKNLNGRNASGKLCLCICVWWPSSDGGRDRPGLAKGKATD